MLNDARARKIALVSHCIFNQNAVVGGLARYPAMVPYIAEILKAHQFGIVQMACPEMFAAGLHRWGQVKEQYQSAGFRKRFDMLAAFFLDTIEDYVQNGDLIILVGIKGSPSCGVFHTESNPNWGGSFEQPIDRDFGLSVGSGAFIDAINKEIAQRGWRAFPSFEISFDDGDSLESIQPLEKFIGQFDAKPNAE